MADHQPGGPTLVCVGNLTIDEAIHGGVRSAPAMGGDAAYAALAARLYLEDVRMLARVGSDLPRWVLDSLHNAGVRADNLPQRDIPTIRNEILYHPGGGRTWNMMSTDDEFDTLSVYPDDVASDLLDADGFMLTAMSLRSQLTLTPWLRTNSRAALYLDVQEDYLDGNRDLLYAMIAVSDDFMPSEIEAVTLAGTNDLGQAARTFQRLGPRTVVIKRAERGSLVLDGDVMVEVPTERTVAVDSTGAGDAFCGAFAANHLISGDAMVAARAGSRAARIAISAFGIDGLVGAFTR